MIKIITKENNKILFSKQEIEFSTFLNNLFFENEEDIIEFKISRVSTKCLKKIKNIIQYIVKNKIEVDDNLCNNYHLNKFIEISPTFTTKMFFEFLDTVNFLHIDVIIKLMCHSIKDDISYLYISDIEKKYNINKDDICASEKLRLELFEKITYKE